MVPEVNEESREAGGGDMECSHLGELLERTEDRKCRKLGEGERA